MKKNRDIFRIYVTLTLAAIIVIFSNETKGQIFTKITDPSNPAASAGCGWIDYNNDNKLDIFLSQFNVNCKLFEGDGAGNWQRMLTSDIILNGSNYSGFSWGDYDNDGKADLYITSMSGNNALFNNQGEGHFINVATSGTTGIGGTYLFSTWVDYNSDGYLDLLIPTTSGLHFTPSGGAYNQLFKNNGDGTFSRVTEHALVTDFGNKQCAVFCDYDNDGDQDVFMTEWGKNNWLYENNGDGNFTKITGTVVNTNDEISITCSWGDYDNDGYMDLFVGNGSVNSQEKQKNYLFHNNGNKTFTKVTDGDVANYSGCVWTSAWADVDNDGDLDLYAGTIYEKEELLYINNGDGTFKKVNEFEINNSSGGTGITGASFGDYDDDGFLDLLVADASGVGALIYQNKGNSNNWIRIACSGTLSNRSAIGARVKVKAQIFGKSYWQIRDVQGNAGFRGLDDLRVHFGLGDATVIDSLIVEWPSKARTIHTNVSINQTMNIREETPVNYLEPRFKIDINTGYSPLTVQFTQCCIYDENNPVTYSWDFDGDGVEDSKEENPVFTYQTNSPEDYTVTLTISNSSESKSILKDSLVKVLPLSMKNLAVRRSASASSVKSVAYPSYRAVDGNLNTYWASSIADTQWIQVKLDSTILIGRAVIKWAINYAIKYRIYCSPDSVTWYECVNVENGSGGIAEHEFDPLGARFVRILATSPANAGKGYNIYEIEVYTPIISDVENLPKDIPGGYTLKQNYPNPFNPETKIGYLIPSYGKVVIKIYDLLGREVQTLVNEEQSAGEHETTFYAEGLSSGIYFARLEAGNYSITKKIVLQK